MINECETKLRTVKEVDLVKHSGSQVAADIPSGQLFVSSLPAFGRHGRIMCEYERFSAYTVSVTLRQLSHVLL